MFSCEDNDEGDADDYSTNAAAVDDEFFFDDVTTTKSWRADADAQMMVIGIDMDGCVHG